MSKGWEKKVIREQGRSLVEMVKELPPEIEEEVKDFVEFLLERRVHKPRATLRLDWRGALRELRDQYTSVGLQHEALEQWGD
jgi:hypothetical protein